MDNIVDLTSSAQSRLVADRLLSGGSNSSLRPRVSLSGRPQRKRPNVPSASIPPPRLQSPAQPRPCRFPPAPPLVNNDFLIPRSYNRPPLLNNHNVNAHRDEAQVAHDHHPVLNNHNFIPNSPAIDEDRHPAIGNNNMNPANGDHGFQNEADQEDVRALLSLPSINIPRNQRLPTPRQMSCQLMEHQKVCLTWLLRQEADESKRGGLLADGMGLGKTIEALALILANPPRNPRRKTTLIVAPLALLRQWQREIATKIKPGYPLATLIFHGPNTRKMTIDELLEYDIVLCTYHKLASEHRTAIELEKPHAVAILHRRAKFYRVILDEAHNIKNRVTKASLGAERIQAKYRLCMTGTPFMNRASEIFPLVRFLHIKPYDQWQRFSEDIDRPIARWEGDMGDRALRKLQTLVRSITLRRTKESRLDGRPIIQLPARHDEDAHAEFDADQAAFYSALEHKQQLKFNKYVKAGTVVKSYIYILVLLLRLRQVCDHPHLIRDHSVPEGVRLSPDEMLGLAIGLPEDVVERLKTMEEFECPICDDKTENAMIISPCGHHVCPVCFSSSMTLRHTNGDGENPARINCPHEECDGQILPDNVTMHNFFVDAHMTVDNDDPANEFFNEEEEEPEEYEYSDDESEDEEEVNENDDLRGFVVNDGDEKYDNRAVSAFRMSGGDSIVDPSSFYEQDGDEEIDPSGEDDTDGEASQRSNSMFVSQRLSPRRRPADETGWSDNWRADTPGNNQLGEIRQEEDGLTEESESEWEVLEDGRTASSNVNKRPATPPLVEQPTTPAPVERATATTPRTERATAAPPRVERAGTVAAKIERNATPGLRTPQAGTAKGTIDDPVHLSDDEELDAFLATARLPSHRSPARPIKQENEVEVIDIETYDGPRSPSIGRRSRKRVPSRSKVVPIKRARTSMRQDNYVDASERRNRRVGPHDNLLVDPDEEEADPPAAPQYNNYYAGPFRYLREDTADAGPPDNFMEPNSPVPSIEPDNPRAANAARRKQKHKKRQKKQKKQRHKNNNNNNNNNNSSSSSNNNKFVSLGELRVDAIKSAPAMHRYRRRLRKEWVSSAKIDKIMSILHTIRDNNDDESTAAGSGRRGRGEKTLIFSLWTSFLDLLAVPIEDAGIVYTRYDGSMQPDHRDAAVKNFQENPAVEVMLVSLTAGNAGLNLTAGSQVIIAEPFWNPYTEEQAIDRAHRIGQTRAVTVHRVLIAGTVEDRILALQEKKRALVNAALSEKGAAQAGRLTVDELRVLFGV